MIMLSTYLVKYYEKNIKYPPKKWNTIDNTIPVLLNPKYFNKDGKISKIIMNIPMTSYKIVDEITGVCDIDLLGVLVGVID